MNDTTPSAGDLFVTQFLVVSDQDRSRDFYQSVFGADVVRDRDPVILALANTRIVLNVGGGPTDDKPTVRLAPPADPDVSSGFLNLESLDPMETEKPSAGEQAPNGGALHWWLTQNSQICASPPLRPVRRVAAHSSGSGSLWSCGV